MSNLLSIFLLIGLIFPFNGFAEEVQSTKIFKEVVADDGKEIRDHMGKHLHGLFNSINEKIGRLGTDKDLSQDEFKELEEELTEMRAHFVAVMPKVPRKIRNLEPLKLNKQFRDYQKELSYAVLYTIRLQETIDWGAATPEKLKARNEELTRLSGRLALLVLRAHGKFRD